MSLNIVIDGYVYDNDGAICSNNVAYQAYFYKVANGSSPSKWNNKRITEPTGYYNFNIGDLDMLSQDGSASVGDVIIIVFWSPSNESRLDTCYNIYEWCVFRIVLTGASIYSFNIQIKDNICPNISWSLPTSGIVNNSIKAINSSNDIHQWNFSNNVMYHRDTWYTNLMSINNIKSNTYEWGDNTTNVNNASEVYHTWSSPGNYTIELSIEDACGCVVSDYKQINIFNSVPVPDIVMYPSDPQPNQVVTFKYIGSDPGNAIRSIAWKIEDGNNNTIFNSTNKNDIIQHTSGRGTAWFGQAANIGAFTNYGSHLISIDVTWWDGFQNKVVKFSKSFFQRKFLGPVINFNQVPTEAEIGSVVKFTNTSTNTDRIGTGLPNHIEYSWRWSNGPQIEYEIDKPISYELEKTPTYISYKVQLCGEWNDGWDNHILCVEKDVVFKTTVSISKEDCYYNLNIIGTSTDGSVTGYGWTVYSGISLSGPWVQTWDSPIDINQNDKKICFTSIDWYKIEGKVYGNGDPTSDYEIMHISTICPSDSSIINIWNGTGVNDVGSDWIRSGYGIETTASKHTGSNGLDATGIKKNDSIVFSAPGLDNIDIINYDFLIIWMNIRSWEQAKYLTLQLHAVGSKNSNTVVINKYIDMTMINLWQKVVIPIDNIFQDTDQIYVNKITLTFDSGINMWIDDISISIGTIEIETIPICAPDINSEYVDYGNTMSAIELIPNMKGSVYIDPTSAPNRSLVNITAPSITGRRTISKFPAPINI